MQRKAISSETLRAASKVTFRGHMTKSRRRTSSCELPCKYCAMPPRILRAARCLHIVALTEAFNVHERYELDYWTKNSA